MSTQRATRPTVLLLLLFACATSAFARSKSPQRESLANYIARVHPQNRAAAAPASPGSLWTDAGVLADIAQDYKAHRAGDLVQVVIVQDTNAENTGSVGSDRSFTASSGVDALPAQLKTTKIQDLFSPHSAATLAGKASASSTLKLRTTLSGRIVAVLDGGVFVIEAERTTNMNNEKQTVVLRGVARSGDIAPDNSLLSTALSDLEIELKGRGVISDGTRPPNALVRLLLKILNF